MATKEKAETCRWVGLTDALTAFVLAESGTQGQRHIKPMHWYTACRLVIEVTGAGEVTDFISNYAQAMTRLAGRRDLRDEISRYEAISLVLASPNHESLGQIVGSFPDRSSPLQFSKFFDRIYREYDLRFVYGAPNLRRTTRRLIWASDSPALRVPLAAQWVARIGEEDLPDNAEFVEEDQPES